MKCPQCNSTSYRKNGYRRGKQCYQCHVCGRQFVESPIPKKYPVQIKQLCLNMYLNGMGLRGIERVTGVHHTTIMNWIRAAGMKLPDAPEESEIPQITEIDELQTFVGCKKHLCLDLDCSQSLATRDYLMDYRRSASLAAKGRSQ